MPLLFGFIVPLKAGYFYIHVLYCFMLWDHLEWFRLRVVLIENCSDHNKCCIRWSNIRAQLFLYFWHLRGEIITGLTRSPGVRVTQVASHPTWQLVSDGVMISSPKLSRDQFAVCFVSTRISNSIPWRVITMVQLTCLNAAFFSLPPLPFLNSYQTLFSQSTTLDVCTWSVIG